MTEEALKTMERFLDCWKRRDYAGMLLLSQVSWVASVPEPEEMLRAMFSFRLFSYRIIDITEKSEVAIGVCLSILYSIARNVVKEMTIEGRVVKEKEPLVPCIDGVWGVNPPSFKVF